MSGLLKVASEESNYRRHDDNASSPKVTDQLCHTISNALIRIWSLMNCNQQSIISHMYPLKPICQALLVLVTLFLCGLNQSIASEIKNDLKKCAMEQTALKRLDCYDALAKKYQLVTQQNFIEPPEEFLTSKLTVTPWNSEYTLTVDGFVKLIKSAVMDDGEKIEVHGWTRQGRDYVLNITMRRPLRLRFLPLETATDDIPMSLLRNLIIDGETTDPGLFITTIASMVPDENSTEPQ